MNLGYVIEKYDSYCMKNEKIDPRYFIVILLEVIL